MTDTKLEKNSGLPSSGLWTVYVMTTVESPSIMQGFPNQDAYMYIANNSAVMSSQDFYDLIQYLNGVTDGGETVEPPETGNIIGQFTEQSEALLIEIDEQYGITWLNQNADEEG